MTIYKVEPPPLSEPPPSYPNTVNSTPKLAPNISTSLASPEHCSGLIRDPLDQLLTKVPALSLSSEDRQVYSHAITVDNTPRGDLNLPQILSDEEATRKDINDKRLNDIKNQCSSLISELANSTQNPKAIVKRHIIELNKYNELKEIALGLITMIADQRKVKTMDILEEIKFELNE